MRNLTKTAAFVGASLMIGNAAYAQDGVGPQNLNPWKECGIGALIFDENETLAIISNVIWDLGTTAVISALASPDTCEGTATKAAIFIQRTHDPLLADTAVGEGEYLDSLLTGIGCDMTVRPQLVAELRGQMTSEMQNASYAAKDYSSKAEGYFMTLREVVHSDPSGSCEPF